MSFTFISKSIEMANSLFYRSMQSKTPEALAKGVALGFMGVRTEAWPETKRSELAAFFAQVGFKPTSSFDEGLKDTIEFFMNR